jgi:transcriptional regulator with XRE-family HTH domain
MNKKLNTLLKLELEKRKKRNKEYSLRALSRDIDLSATIVSDFLNNKRNLSKKSLYKITFFLKIPVYLISEFSEPLANKPTKKQHKRPKAKS